MTDRLKRAWRGLEMFLTLRDLAGLILGLAPWAGSAAVVAGLLALRWLAADPANAVAAGFIVLVIVYVVALVARAQLRRTVPVAIEPLTGPGPLRIAIRNLIGRPAEFYVNAQLIARRNDRGGQPIRTGNYAVPWEHSSRERAEIASGDAATIVIGRFQLWYQEGLAQMDLPQVTGAGERSFESSRWNMKPNEPLPEYDVELSVFSPAFPQPRVERFTVRPAKFSGPLELLSTTR